MSVIAGQYLGDNTRLYAMELRLRLKRASPQRRLEPGTARSVGKHLTHLATGAPDFAERSLDTYTQGTINDTFLIIIFISDFSEEL